MDLRDMQYFVSIAETGSFTRAAAQNSVAQSALSRRMRELEEELGVTLFYRNGRGVVPTDTGTVFLARIRRVLADIQQIRHDISAMRSTAHGTVTLGVPPSVGLVLLAPLLAQIRQDFPGIQMRVLEGFSGHVAEWLSSGRVDLAVLYNVRSNALLDAEHLLFEDMQLVSSRSAPRLGRGNSVALKELDGMQMALPGRPHGLRVLVDEACAKAGVTLEIVLELETLPTIKTLVATGTIRTILPTIAVHDEIEAGNLHATKIVDPVISRELILAHAPQRANAPATRVVARLIRQHIETLVRSGHWRGRI
jgi:LysR family nitrogen assimilation transcriptional regulator